MKSSSRSVQTIEELENSGFSEVKTCEREIPAMDLIDKEFEQRLHNWGRVVGDNCRVAANCTAAWAAEFCANRDSREYQLALRLNVIERPTVMQEIENQVFSEAQKIDGWLIESVWTLLSSFEHKQVLRFKYVFGWRDEVIRRKLRLRGNANLRLILWRAKTSVKQRLEKLNNQHIIQPNNLTAGKSVPAMIRESGSRRTR